VKVVDQLCSTSKSDEDTGAGCAAAAVSVSEHQGPGQSVRELEQAAQRRAGPVAGLEVVVVVNVADVAGEWRQAS